ncbi:MAG: WYL domain-containing protein [Candidatus Competibacteraceae bacterium]|nr:WYL domain-containing protein [Candidatus Competibacteraceae bacterium]
MPFTETCSQLQNLTYAQRERLAYIDFCLEFHGSIGRSELMSHFGTAVASSTRDFTLYRELAPRNLALRHEDKRYYRTDDCQPLFQHDSAVILKALAQGFGDGISTALTARACCEEAPGLIIPPSHILASLMRAITQGKAIRAKYLSLSSGRNQRVIVPHTIVNNGQRWHVRAYDRKNGEFRDFVCTRFTEICPDDAKIQPHEQQAADTEWNRYLPLELIPHPGLKQPDAIALDFDMASENGNPVRILNVRAARTGYLLRYWNVDCSPDHHLPAREHHLWLRSHQILKHCINAVLAPGYTTTPNTASAPIS